MPSLGEKESPQKVNAGRSPKERHKKEKSSVQKGLNKREEKEGHLRATYEQKRYHSRGSAWKNERGQKNFGKKKRAYSRVTRDEDLCAGVFSKTPAPVCRPRGREDAGRGKYRKTKENQRAGGSFLGKFRKGVL